MSIVCAGDLEGADRVEIGHGNIRSAGKLWAEDKATGPSIRACAQRGDPASGRQRDNPFPTRVKERAATDLQRTSPANDPKRRGLRRVSHPTSSNPSR